MNKKGGYSYICSNCNSIIIYKDRRCYKKALNKNLKCKLCRNKELYIKYECLYCKIKFKRLKKEAFKKNNSIYCKDCYHNRYYLLNKPLIEKETKRICSSCNSVRLLKNPLKEIENYLCKSCLRKKQWEDPTSIFNNIEFRKKKSKDHINRWKNNSYRSYILSCVNRIDVRLKKRLSMIKSMVNKRKNPAYNKLACQFIDKLNKERGWNLQHAENGGELLIEELGYFVDGYDKGNNIFFEYDEPHHYYANGILKFKDYNRQKNILKFLKRRETPFKFVRFDEKRNKLYEVN